MGRIPPLSELVLYLLSLSSCLWLCLSGVPHRQKATQFTDNLASSTNSPFFVLKVPVIEKTKRSNFVCFPFLISVACVDTGPVLIWVLHTSALPFQGSQMAAEERER